MLLDKQIAIGAYIGGSHFICAAVNTIKGEIVPGTYFKGMINNDASSGLILTIFSTYLKKTIDAVGRDTILGIGCSTPGPFDYQNGIANFVGVPKYERLNGVNITMDLRKRLGLNDAIPIRFINDAIGFALGEDWARKGHKYASSIAIMLDEGFGSAFLRNGMPIIKGDTIPHKGVVYNLPYKQGIADDYFSTRGILNTYKQLGGSNFNRVASLANIAHSDRKIQQIFNDFGYNLAEFLLPIFRKFHADVCVFGGSISDHFNLFGASLRKYLVQNGQAINIEVSGSQDNSFILGASKLLVDQQWLKLAPILPDLD